jgi:hypothetical protein
VRSVLLPSFLAVGLGLSEVSAAEPIPLIVEYEAPDDCPTAADFLAALQSRTPRARLATADEAIDAVQLRVTVHVSSPGSWGSLMLLDDGDITGRRQVAGATCAEVVDALALATALSLDPTALLRAEPEPVVPKPNATAPPDAPPAPTSSETAPRGGRAPGSPGWVLRLGTAAIFTQPLVPAPFWGGMPEVGAARGRHGPALHLAYSFSLGDGDHSRFAWQAVRATFHAWRVPLGRRAEFGLGAAAEAGILRAEGLGLDPSRQVDRWSWGAGLDARFEVALAPGFAVSLSAGALVPAAERRFTIGEPPREIAATPPLVPLAALGLGARLPIGARTRNDQFQR